MNRISFVGVAGFLGLMSTACVSSELKSAVSAYAEAVEHEATASKALLGECLSPAPNASPEDHKQACDAARSGYDAINESAKKLKETLSK